MFNIIWNKKQTLLRAAVAANVSTLAEQYVEKGTALIH